MKLQDDLLKLIITDDGSSSITNLALNENYHSTRGAIGESLHVYIEKGLNYLKERGGMNKSVKILEIGFGTGLNAILSMDWASKSSQKVAYTTIEQIPLEEPLYAQLQFKNWQENTQKIHQSPWQIPFELSPFFSLTKIKTTLESYSNPDSIFDLIYFDAFSPSKQPGIWQIQTLANCFRWLVPNGVLVTYCAQGQFKRNLKELGFVVEVLQGAMGKWEMVRGTKPSNKI